MPKNIILLVFFYCGIRIIKRTISSEQLGTDLATFLTPGDNLLTGFLDANKLQMDKKGILGWSYLQEEKASCKK